LGSFPFALFSCFHNSIFFLKYFFSILLLFTITSLVSCCYSLFHFEFSFLVLLSFSVLHYPIDCCCFLISFFLLCTVVRFCEIYLQNSYISILINVFSSVLFEAICFVYFILFFLFLANFFVLYSVFLIPLSPLIFFSHSSVFFYFLNISLFFIVKMMEFLFFSFFVISFRMNGRIRP
jgi:hypothetical protein